MATTKKATTKTESKAEVKEITKTEAARLENNGEEYVEIYVDYDDSTDEEGIYISVNGDGIYLPYGQTVKVKQPIAAEYNLHKALQEAIRRKRDQLKREQASNGYVNTTT